MKLKKYIKRNFGTHTAYAAHAGVNRQQVDRWVTKDYRVIMIKGKPVLFGKVRELPEIVGGES